MGKRFLASVANVELFEKKDNKLTHFASAKTLTDSAFGFTLSMEEVRAGQGGKLYGRFVHTSGMTFTMTDAMFDIEYIRALLGAEKGVGGSVLHTDTFSGGAASQTLTKTAVGMGNLCGMKDIIAWGHVADCNGESEDKDFVVTKNAIDLSMYDAEDKVCVTYFVQDPSATLMKIKAKFIPAELVAIATVQEFAGDASAPESGKPAGELVIKIPRFQLDGQFDLTLNMTSAASIALNGTALAVSSGDCNGEDYYAEIIEKAEGADWRTNLKDFVIDPEHLKVGEAPVIFGISNNGGIFSIPNDAIQKQETTAGEKDGFSAGAVTEGKWAPIDGDSVTTREVTVTIYKANGDVLKAEKATVTK